MIEVATRTIGGHNLTEEMNLLMDAIEAGEDVKGDAKAGAGKSTLLRAVEKYHVGKRGIYLCYNKSLEHEARTLFKGSNVHIYTFHSYSLSTFDSDVKSSFLRKVNIKPSLKLVLKYAGFNLDNELFDILDINKNWRVLVDICNCFIQTASLAISDIHLTEEAKKLITSKINSKQLKASQKSDAVNYLVNHSSLLLKSMFETNQENECFCTHDAYVKYWQLSNPVIKYDYIMFDETQDAPPVLINIIFNQKCQKIFVGDGYQNIYQFKGGVNAMNVLPVESFPMTNAFRYGQPIADLATSILKHANDSVIITGRGNSSIFKGSEYNGNDDILYVSHTNIHLLDVLIDCFKIRVPTAFIADKKAEYTLIKAETLISLSQGGEGIGFYKRYNSIDRFIASERDLETKTLVDWFKDDREKFTCLVDALRWSKEIDPDKAHIRLTTAHGSKGLEANVVMLADDYGAVINAFGDGKPLPEDELNLIYVAVTRARKVLIIADKLYEALHKNLAFTLNRTKPNKCMMDNLIPESYTNSKSKKTHFKKTSQQPKSTEPEKTVSTKRSEPEPDKTQADNSTQSLASSKPKNEAQRVQEEAKSSPAVAVEVESTTGEAKTLSLESQESKLAQESSNEIKIVVGQAADTGENLFWCPTDTSLYLNPNLAVAGTMGTGKTQTVKSMVTQLVRQRSKNTDGENIGILIFDYKSDYVDDAFVNATNAKVLSPNNLPINPFALHSDQRMALMNTAKVFVTTLSTAFRLGPKQGQTLKNCIVSAYENKGIDNGNVETYANTPPTMRDVFSVYNNQAKIPQDSLTAALSDLYDFEVFESNGRKCKTLYDMLDNDVVVVSLGGIDSELQNLIVAVLLDQFYTQMHIEDKPKPKGQYRALKKLILVDEADNFMSQNFPSLRKILKEGREFGVGCLLSTQGLDHFQTSENQYSDYITAWICHRLNNPKNKDIEQLLNTKTKQDLESSLNAVRELEKHYALFVNGKKQVTHQQSTMFWKLIQQN